MIKLKELSKPRNLAVIALLIAANVVAGRMLSIHTPIIKIGFSFVTVAFAAYFFGPVAAALVGGIGDIISALLTPEAGAYFPGFTLTAILMGICFGVFLYEKTSIIKISLSVLINELAGSTLMNTYWIYFLSSKSGSSKTFMTLLIARMTTQIPLMIAVEIIILWLLFGKSMIMENIKKAIDRQK